MVVYNVFNSCVSYQHKTYLCSKATALLLITSVLTVFFPVLFTYRNQGFWLRTEVYQDQPYVSYKYDYILLIDTAIEEDLIICSNLPSIPDLTKGSNHCPFIKAQEDDINRDGINDILKATFKITLADGTKINGVTLLLFFDYKLTSYCRVHMEAMGVIQHNYVESRAGFSTIADLSFVQRQPLNPLQVDTRYNTSVVPSSSPFSLSDILTQYSLRNVTARLTNVYSAWLTGRTPSEPFTLQVTIMYSEASVRYKPTTWHVLQAGWAKLFPILVISMLVFRAVQKFIFNNQLVYTFKDIPWKKAY